MTTSSSTLTDPFTLICEGAIANNMGTIQRALTVVSIDVRNAQHQSPISYLASQNEEKAVQFLLDQFPEKRLELLKEAISGFAFANNRPAVMRLYALARNLLEEFQFKIRMTENFAKTGNVVMVDSILRSVDPLKEVTQINRLIKAALTGYAIVGNTEKVDMIRTNNKFAYLLEDTIVAYAQGLHIAAICNILQKITDTSSLKNLLFVAQRGFNSAGFPDHFFLLIENLKVVIPSIKNLLPEPDLGYRVQDAGFHNKETENKEDMPSTLYLRGLLKGRHLQSAKKVIAQSIAWRLNLGIADYAEEGLAQELHDLRTTVPQVAAAFEQMRSSVILGFIQAGDLDAALSFIVSATPESQPDLIKKVVKNLKQDGFFTKESSPLLLMAMIDHRVPVSPKLMTECMKIIHPPMEQLLDKLKRRHTLTVKEISEIVTVLCDFASHELERDPYSVLSSESYSAFLEFQKNSLDDLIKKYTQPYVPAEDKELKRTNEGSPMLAERVRTLVPVLAPSPLTRPIHFPFKLGSAFACVNELILMTGLKLCRSGVLQPTMVIHIAAFLAPPELTHKDLSNYSTHFRKKLPRLFPQAESKETGKDVSTDAVRSSVTLVR